MAEEKPPKTQEELIRIRKAVVEAKYGVGAYEKATKKIQPHRCARHLDDVMHGLTHWDANPIAVFFSCLFSQKGNEPQRMYPDSDPFSALDKPSLPRKD